MSDGFLGRWSKRKLEVKEGKASLAESTPPPQELAAKAAEVAVVPEPALEQPVAAELPVAAVPEERPALTLEDVNALTSESDFTRFTASDVAPEIKNAAMKKLFADPRYNVMDGLDTYIDDYSKPDPIPHAMLRQLVSAKFLGLFDKEEKEEEEAAAREAAGRAREVADNPTAQSVAKSEPAPQAVPEAPIHADPDLRLQQDHAAPGEDPGRGTQ